MDELVAQVNHEEPPPRSRENAGWVEVIAGSMFSGKSEELIRRLRRAKIARQKVRCFRIQKCVTIPLTVARRRKCSPKSIRIPRSLGSTKDSFLIMNWL